MCVSVFFLPDEVTMRARAAGRACHCCSLFHLFCFLPEEEKVLHRNQQPLGVTPSRRLSVFYLRTSIFLHVSRKNIYREIYIDIFFSFLNCICKHARYFLRGSQPVKTSLCNSEASDKTFPEQSLLLTIFTSQPLCTVYLINIIQAQHFWLICWWYCWVHPCTAACMWGFIFVFSLEFCWFVSLAVGPTGFLSHNSTKLIGGSEVNTSV